MLYEPFIFYGIVSNVISISFGYYIYFKDASINVDKHGIDKPIPISIFIPNNLLEKYHKRKHLLKYFELIPQKTSISTAYFIGAYHKLITSPKGTPIYSIEFNHLNQLWIEWNK